MLLGREEESEGFRLVGGGFGGGEFGLSGDQVEESLESGF